MMEKLQVQMLYLKCLQAVKVTIDKHMQNTCVTCNYFEGATPKDFRGYVHGDLLYGQTPKKKKVKLHFNLIQQPTM